MSKRTKLALRVAQDLKRQQLRAVKQLRHKPHLSAERIMRVRIAAKLREAIWNLESRL